MFSSSESWGLQQHPRLWHSRAGGGAVHSINRRQSSNQKGFGSERHCSTSTTDQTVKSFPSPPTSPPTDSLVPPASITPIPEVIRADQPWTNCAGSRIGAENGRILSSL